MEFLRRMDRAWVRGEGWLTVGVLLLMVLVAGFQAFVRNLTRFDIQWANEMLTDMEWADSLLRKGTLWLAFLGASIATYRKKHIALDVMLRIAPVKAKYTMIAMSTLIASVITVGLVISFWDAVILNLTERPIEYELLGDDGSIHVCDATAEQLAELQDMERPSMFCAFRSVLSVFGVPAETPGAAFQLIVPLMFLAMALRFFAQSVGAMMVLAGGPDAIERAEALEREELRKQQASTESLPPPAADQSQGGQS